MKTRRTRRYTPTGQRMYTTLNKTSKQVSYSNTNPQFVMTCKAKNEGGKGCTNAGCGSQCCQLSFLVSDISHSVWMAISGIRPGQILKNSGGVGLPIGTIKEIVFPCACCQDIDLIGNNAEDNFPLNMRILAKPASGSCANSGYTGGNLWTAQAKDISGDSTIEEPYEVMGTSNVGAPYRNPIKGWRKTLDCCPCENVIVTGDFNQTPMTSTLIGGVLSYGTDSWIIEGYSEIPGTSFGYSLTLQNNHCSKPPEAGITFKSISGQSSTTHYTIVSVEEITGRSRLVADDIYKDNYSGPKSSKSGCCPGNGQATSGIQARTQRPIIRSGMQPKPTICCKTGKATAQCKSSSSNCITKNNYSYDYHQYLHNRSLKSFKRSEDKFFTMYPDGNGTVQATLGGYCSKPAYGHGCNSINNIPMIYTKGTCREGHHCVATVGKINPTIYKPNNRKFSKQGAVTSSGRLERLKLNTIRTANSKCPKGHRCRNIVARNGHHTKTYLSPKGPYFAGEPRFTGWMYNARHPERVCMLRYRQQPFGIPQLTNKQRATRSNRPVHYPDTYVTMSGLQSAFTFNNNPLTLPSIQPYDGDPGLHPPLWYTSPEPGDCIIQLQKPASSSSADCSNSPPPGSTNFNPNGQNLNWLSTAAPSARGTIVSVDNWGLSSPLLTIKTTYGSFQNPTTHKSADTIVCTDAALYTMIVGKTTCPPVSPDGPQWWSAGASYPRPAPPSHPNVRLYQTDGWSMAADFTLPAPVDPTPTRGNIGIWQRGRSNPRAPACKCVPQGAAGCPGAKCDKHCGIGQLAQNPGSPCCK